MKTPIIIAKFIPGATLIFGLPIFARVTRLGAATESFTYFSEVRIFLALFILTIALITYFLFKDVFRSPIARLVAVLLGGLSAVVFVRMHLLNIHDLDPGRSWLFFPWPFFISTLYVVFTAYLVRIASFLAGKY